MKTFPALLVATLFLFALSARCQEGTTSVAAAPTQAMGVITGYDATNNVISMTPKGSVTPLAFRYTPTTVMVNEAGEPLLIGALTQGTVATFLYRTDKDTMVLVRIIVHSVPLPAAAPTPST